MRNTVNYSLGRVPLRAGFEIHAFRRRFKAVGSAVLSGYAHVTALARRDCAEDSARYSTARLFAEPITETSHGFNRVAGVAELFAESAHVRVHSAGVDHALVAPDVVKQFIAVLHTASALD